MARVRREGLPLIVMGKRVYAIGHEVIGFITESRNHEGKSPCNSDCSARACPSVILPEEKEDTGEGGRIGIIAGSESDGSPREVCGFAPAGRPITESEFDRIVAAMHATRTRDGNRWEWLLRGLWLSGLRLGEALRLSWDGSTAISVVVKQKSIVLRFLAEGHKAFRDEDSLLIEARSRFSTSCYQS